MKITHYDLFAGIGGFSYALDQVFYDQEIKHIFCEWEAFPTAVLKKHWPDATYYGDIADLVADTGREHGQQRADSSDREATIGTPSADEAERLVVVTGGFPCQPFSQAGRKKGTADNRYKWPEMFAVTKNIRPDWIIAENVRGLASWNDGMVLETVCADLEAKGYETRPYIIPACSVGAPHKRERVWIVAHTVNGGQRRTERESDETSDRVSQEHWTKDSAPRELERATSNREHDKPSWQADWREVALATCHDGVDDGLPRRLDGATLRGKRTDQISASQHRKERLKACGNAIVPQVAIEIFKAIKQSSLKKVIY